MEDHLTKIIIKKIKERPLTFYEFMNMALYHPLYGYYVKNKPKIGKEGDFYTSVNVHSAFGSCIAEQLYEIWQIMKEINPFIIVEMGPGTGLLAKDILTYSKRHEDFYPNIQYVLIEKSQYLKEIQRKELELFYDKCSWKDTLMQLKPFSGVIISNELLDSFPVHKITLKDGILREVYVNYNNNRFCEEIGDISNQAIYDFVSKINLDLIEEQEIEVNIDAIDWLNDIAESLTKGFVLTIDYGYTVKELKEPFRFKGTLMSYKGHRSSAEVLDSPGNQDITSHVNFSSIIEYGRDFGLDTVGYTTQMRFLINLNIQDKMNITGKNANIKDAYALKRLIMPDGMGERFKVLIQSKNIKVNKLKGLHGFFKPLNE